MKTQPAMPNSFSIYQNIGDATVKGAEIKVILARTSGFAGTLGYTLTDASGRNLSFANTQNNIAWTMAEPPIGPSVDFGQRHRLTAVADLQSGPSDGPQLGDWHPLANTGICVLADIGSGFPYSPSTVYNEVALSSFLSPMPAGPINSGRTDWTFRIDLKANKSFPVFNADLELYVWVINLFDRDNVVDVYSGTGEPDNTGYLDTPEGGQFISNYSMIHDSSYLTGEQKYELRQNDPANFDIPRQIRFGVRAGF